MSWQCCSYLEFYLMVVKQSALDMQSHLVCSQQVQAQVRVSTQTKAEAMPWWDQCA